MEGTVALPDDVASSSRRDADLAHPWNIALEGYVTTETPAQGMRMLGLHAKE